MKQSAPMQLLLRINRAWGRRAASWFAQSREALNNERPLVSFTFDDFPKSALTCGGAILVDHGCRGTYYTSFGLMGTTAPTGEIFELDDLPQLWSARHEMGCHTFHHYDAWTTLAKAYCSSVTANREALEKVLPEVKFDTHSFPISFPRISTKRWLSRQFLACRGGGQINNGRILDLANLKSCFLERCSEENDSLERLVHSNAQQNGWLIFSTHDVSRTPTKYGCSPTMFKKALQLSLSYGSLVLPIGEVLHSYTSAKRNSSRNATSSSQDFR